jgi:Leucine-rich repeat (LRR) protein
MADSTRSRFRLPHWGWFLLAMVLLVVAAVGLSIWLPYHREQQVVQRIQTIESWWDTGERDYWYETETGGPEWLRQLAGKERMKEFKVFERVVFVRLEGAAIPAGEIGQLSGLTNLDYLNLVNTAVTDAGLAHLSKLPKLRELFLDGTAITDVGLDHLSGCTNLERLGISETAVTDAGLAHLSRLPKLQEVFLDGTAVTDLGLGNLSGSASLTYLSLDRTAVTDKGIKRLQQALPQCHVQH